MQELAELLKSERLKQGLTLPVLSERLRVSINMLEAMEEGNFERIGTPLLIRSFLRSYCGAVGLDGEALIQKYEAAIRACDQQDRGIKRFGKWSKGLGKKKRIGVFSIVLFGIAVVGVVYGGAWFWKYRLHGDAPQSLTTSGYPQQDLPADLSDKAGPGVIPKPVKEATVAGDQGVRSAPEVTSSDILPEAKEKPTAAEIADKHQFTVEATQKTWVQVTMDDKITQNAMLEPGDMREWEAEQGMRIVIGNAGGVSMKWDGRPVDIPARPGSVLRFTLPDERHLKE